jgi:hypothetical protein
LLMIWYRLSMAGLRSGLGTVFPAPYSYPRQRSNQDDRRGQSIF